MTKLDSLKRSMPLCLVGSSCDDATSIAELAALAETELDLIDEGQDGTEDCTPADRREILRFLRRCR